MSVIASGSIALSLATLSSACCIDGVDGSGFGLRKSRALPSGIAGSEERGLEWGIESSARPEDTLLADNDDDDLPARLLRLFAADGSELPLVSMQELVPGDHDGCEHFERTWSLSGIPEGRYSLVHFRYDGDTPNNCASNPCPWTGFADREALVVTLDVSPGAP